VPDVGCRGRFNRTRFQRATGGAAADNELCLRDRRDNAASPLGYALSRGNFGNWTRALRLATLLVGQGAFWRRRPPERFLPPGSSRGHHWRRLIS